MPLSEQIKAQLKAAGKTDAEIAAIEAASDKSKTTPTKTTTPVKTKTTQPTTTKYPSIYSTTQANAAINDFFKKTFGRDATSEELNKYRAALIQAQKNNPSVQTYDPATKTQTTTGGLDEQQWLTEQITKDPIYVAELQKISTTSQDVLKRQKDKNNYLQALKDAGNDKAKIDALNQTSPYGMAINGLKDRIRLSADNAGAVIDEATVEQLAKEAYDTNQDSNAYTFQTFLNNKFKFGTTGFKGEAASNVNELTKIARANGLDLNKAFGTQLPSWLEALNKGANIEDYKKIIRDVAKIGMPEKVAKLIDQGVDLDTIYSPYKNLMANTLEINPETITLNDPTLRTAITAENEVPLYQFERQLRQDNRWQYTNQARSEVADAAKRILQDFGFMG